MYLVLGDLSHLQKHVGVIAPAWKAVMPLWQIEAPVYVLNTTYVWLFGEIQGGAK